MSTMLQVMKFGGTSVGDAACIARTAQIIATAAKKNQCVVVVSAMSGVTNRLMTRPKKPPPAIPMKAPTSLKFCAGNMPPRWKP